ncbi:MAG: hypothetical protein QF464_08685, partial [Myxococcota bacterium]|nr:hypothetical protein [Myxococcota bacterium]
DTPITDVFRMISDLTGWSIMTSPAVTADPPKINLWVRLLLGSLTLLCLGLAFRERATGPRRRWWVRLSLTLVQLAVGLCLFAVLLWMHASGYITALIVSPTAALVWAVVEGAVLAGCAWWAWRRPSWRPWALGISATALFVGSFMFIVLTTWMWFPPSPDVCQAVVRPGQVERLSPAEWAQEPSQPYSLLYIPEEGWLMGAFKMGGTGVLSFWNEPSANRVLGVDTRAPSRTGVMSFHGRKFPMHMTYRPETRELLVSRMGPGVHSVDLLNLAKFPEMTLVRATDIDFAPHDVVTHPSASAFGVLGQHGDFALIGESELEERYRLYLGLSGDHVPVPLYAWHQPGTSKLYISMLVYPFAELDLDTQEVRRTRELFGGGQLNAEPGASEIFHTDILFDRVDVIDLESLSVTRTIDLDYTPRPIQVDTSRDLLIVGDWFGGVVNFYRLDTMEALDISVPVGPYVRDFAYDPARGLLFTASKCGVYQVQVDAFVPAN